MAYMLWYFAGMFVTLLTVAIGFTISEFGKEENKK